MTAATASVPTQGTIIVIGGPTASGKTKAAVSLAKDLRTEVISADSRQFYKAMRIGTARPLAEELDDVPHHFLGHLELEESWSAGAFANAAEPVLQDVIARTGHVVVVGGSGLYIDALLKGLPHGPAMDPTVRKALQTQFKKDGLATLLEELRELDPAAWERIDRNNPHRVLRALEVCRVTRGRFSERGKMAGDREDHRIVRFAQDLGREELYARIEARVDAMMREGLVEEARPLLPYRELNALRTVGYRELFDHFSGAFSLEEAVALIKQRTRNYAKRQITWLRRENSWLHTPSEDHAFRLAHVTGK